MIPRRRLHRIVFIAAGVYNIGLEREKSVANTPGSLLAEDRTR